MKIIVALCLFVLLAVPAIAAEQFVGVGGGFDTSAISQSAFNFSYGYEVMENQFIATTMRINPNFSETTVDYLNEVVTIAPLKLTVVGIGSVGATSGEGTTKFDFGGGVGGLEDLTVISDKLKNCYLFIGSKFMRNNFNEPDKSGGLNRLIFEFVYRWGE